MKTILASLTLALLCGCDFKPLPSNDPDSGIACFQSTIPAGSGTTDFTVRSAYQNAGVYRNDAGQVSGAQLNLVVSSKAISCVDVRDGGTVGSGFHATIYANGQDRVAVGTYPTSAHADGGPSFVGYVTEGEAGFAKDGTLTLSAIDACSASGSFDVQIGTADGGTRPMTGSFTTDYCIF